MTKLLIFIVIYFFAGIFLANAITALVEVKSKKFGGYFKWWILYIGAFCMALVMIGFLSMGFELDKNSNSEYVPVTEQLYKLK